MSQANFGRTSSTRRRTGPIWQRRPGAHEEHDDLFGATVQIAARVCQAAGPETVVVFGAVRDIVDAKFVFDELGHTHLKGR